MRDLTDMEKIRCRYGPAPTGKLHVGSARTALFIYLFAKSQGGEFILRIDDTDIKASNYDYTHEAIESLKWLGIKWDEGPVYQSHRFDIYKRYIQQLVDSNHAYYEKTERGTAIRFKVQRNRSEFVDLIHGTVEEDLSKYGDFVIQRSDGTPTYQIATVVDDHLMGITHVPRGNDLFRSTHRQNAIYAALGWTPPLYAHIPLVIGPDGRKLSKRHGATGVYEFRDNLYLPEALLNYLSTLGWSSKNKKEILSLSELEKCFSYRNIGKKNVVFDISKLNWLNRQYLKKVDLIDLSKRLFDLLVKRDIIDEAFDFNKFCEIVKLMTPRYYSNCDEFINNTIYFYNDGIGPDDNCVESINTAALTELKQLIANIEEFTYSNIDSTVRNYAKECNTNLSEIVQGLRIAITGRRVTPDIFSILLIIGRAGVLDRMEKFIKYANE